MTKRTAKRTQFLTDVLTTAVEGGINYWALVADYKWDTEDVDADEIGVTVWEQEEDPEGNGEGVRVTLDTIAKGIGILKKNGGVNTLSDSEPGSYWKQFLLADRTNGEDGDYDAGIADCILQAGLFGEVVYG